MPRHEQLVPPISPRVRRAFSWRARAHLLDVPLDAVDRASCCGGVDEVEVGDRRCRRAARCLARARRCVKDPARVAGEMGVVERVATFLSVSQTRQPPSLFQPTRLNFPVANRDDRGSERCEEVVAVMPAVVDVAASRAVGVAVRGAAVDREDVVRRLVAESRDRGERLRALAMLLLRVRTRTWTGCWLGSWRCDAYPTWTCGPPAARRRRRSRSSCLRAGRGVPRGAARRAAPSAARPSSRASPLPSRRCAPVAQRRAPPASRRSRSRSPPLPVRRRRRCCAVTTPPKSDTDPSATCALVQTDPLAVRGEEADDRGLGRIGRTGRGSRPACRA